MFCLYCGTNLPEDAVFCNKCGKRQNTAANEPATDIDILPFPTLPEASTGGGQLLFTGNVPMVQGTPSTSNSSSAQSFAHSAANAAPSDQPSSVPPMAASAAPHIPTQYPEQQSGSFVHQADHQIESHAYSPYSAPSTASYIESPTSSAPYPHAVDQRVLSDGVKLAGNLSRRAVIASLAGITGLAVVGGGLAWLTLSRRPQGSSTSPSAGTQSSTLSPTVPPAAVVNLEYSTNLDRWGINYDRPSAISLSTTPPANNWTLPPNRGIQRLFGNLSFGDNTQVGVVIDRLTNISASNPYYNAEVVFNFVGGTDFSNQPTYESSGSGSQPIEFTINYSNGSHQLFAIVIYTAAVNNNYGFNYYRACVRQGTARLDGVDYPIAITSENNDGIYSNLDSVDITLDLNGNGTFEDSEHFSASKPFVLRGTSYVIRSITSDGSSMTIIKTQ